jgi:hypothetical protein
MMPADRKVLSPTFRHPAIAKVPENARGRNSLGGRGMRCGARGIQFRWDAVLRR